MARESVWLITKVRGEEHMALAVLRAPSAKKALEDYFITSLKPKGFKKVKVTLSDMVVTRLGIKTSFAAKKP